MRPESASITLRRDLTVVAQEFDSLKAQRLFIGDRAAPIAVVEEVASTYPVITRESFKRPATSTRRTEGAAYPRIEGTFGSASYECEEHGLEEILDDRRAARYRTFLNFERWSTLRLRHQILMARERRVAALYSGAGLTNHNVATAWSTVADAVPINDILTGVQTVEDACGCIGEDLTLIIPRADFRELLQVTQIVDKTKYTYPGIQPANLAASQIATMLGLKQVLLARGSYDSADEGIAAGVAAQIWTAGVMYLALLAEPGADLESPSAMRTMVWSQDGGPEIPIVERYRSEERRSEVLRMREDTDEVATAEADLMAYQLTNN